MCSIKLKLRSLVLLVGIYKESVDCVAPLGLILFDFYTTTRASQRKQWTAPVHFTL